MRFLILFATTEGHTRELCQFIAGALRGVRHQATLEEATRDTAERVLLTSYDAVLLAGSLHVGRFQPELVELARRHHEALNAKPTAFITVSLAAAGHNPDDWEGLETCLRRFQHETLWTPTCVHNAAGAIRYSQYDFFKRLALKHIARERGLATTTSKDYDLTDYAALEGFVLEFAARVSRDLAGASAPSAAAGVRAQGD